MRLLIEPVVTKCDASIEGFENQLEERDTGNRGSCVVASQVPTVVHLRCRNI